ncbi:MAG: hypothetical protein KTR16_08970 [Acidiferrobacterales bacterium]|nr:hypothetical protein [Acidiferrobacterales bacterium]
MKIKHSLAGLLALLTLTINAVSFAGLDTETNENGVTLGGYDVVSYFTENAAVEGSADFTAVHNNAIYYFSSSDNRDLFNANPEKFTPQYGGFCAYGAAIGAKFPIDPKVFAVVDNKLYVNNSANVAKLWNAKQAKAITLADKKWPTIKAVAAEELEADDDLDDE